MVLGIPFSTLKDRLKSNNLSKPQLGRHKPIFTNGQEREIVQHCIYLAKMFYGLTPIDLRKLIFEYAESNSIAHRFNATKRMAGKDWYSAFMKRNPYISLRKPEATSLGRISGFNQDSVALFYKNLGGTLEKLQIGPHRIFNMDETGITTVQVPTKVIAPKGTKQLGKAVSYERGRNITVCGCISASGSFIPPMFIYPRARMSDQLKRNGPVGAKYTCSLKGWITEELFVEWLHHFKLHTACSIDNPVLLIVDNHTSHCSLPAYNFCRANGITVVSFPPHTSHKLQPLDLTVFGPLKKAYSNECSTFMRQNPHQKITPYDVAEIFNKAFVKIATIEKAQKGFQVSGICPYNPSIFSQDDFLPAVVPLTTLVTDDNEEGSIQDSNVDASTDIAQPQNARETDVIDFGASTSKASTAVDQPKDVSKSDAINFGASSSKAPGQKPKRYVQFKELSPIVTVKKGMGVVKKTLRSMTSKVLTATPEKEYLEEKQRRKEEKCAKNKNSKSEHNTKLHVRRGVEKVKKRVLEESSSSDESIEAICDDRSSDEMEDVMEDEVCIICNEFGKTEMWYQCGLCKKWAHKGCTGHEGSKPFICDFCM